MQAFTHAHNLQRGTNDIRKMLGDSGNESVCIAHAHHQRAENIPVIEERASFGECYASALTESEKLVDVAFPELGFINIHNTGTSDIDA
jgi:hypothetical protein